jgi:hypothetical protein
MKRILCFCFLIFSLHSSAQYHGGNADGYGGISILNQNPLTNIYGGGGNDGVSQALVLNQNPLTGIYTGGGNDGVSQAQALAQNPLTGFYTGGGNDGVSQVLVLQQNFLPGIYAGGANDGVNFALVLNQNPLASIYKGGGNDGVAFSLSLNQNNGVPLDIELLAFTGVWKGEDALLEWSAASEDNLLRYELERSDDLGVTFSMISSAAPANSGSQQSEYSYTDAGAYGLPPAMLFYRLKCVGKDGKFKYSAVARLNKDKTQPTIVAYPNPTSGRFTLALTNTTDISGYSYMITASDGRMIQRGAITTAFTDFDLSHFAAATYHVFVVKDGKPIQNITILLTP